MKTKIIAISWLIVFLLEIAIIAWVLGVLFSSDDATTRFFTWIYFVSVAIVFSMVGAETVSNLIDEFKK